MNNRVGFSSLEYLTVFFLTSFCVYIFVPEFRTWVHEHAAMILNLR